MSLTRKCAACGEMVRRAQYIELIVRVLTTSGSEDQNPIEQAYDDYCDGCVLDGSAVADLLRALAKYTARKAS
jgi:hypothetical protein